jgi:CubicO group peptidase (beta-lactamase class C family)
MMASLLGLSAHADGPDEVARQIARVESANARGGQGLDALTLPQVMAQLHVPGASIAVINNFEIQWAKGYGVADAATGRAVTVSTRFQAASISKPVTAMAVMRLVQEGKLALDGDVNTLLKSWRIPKSAAHGDAPVTPRSLLSHTSGAIDGFGFPGYAPQAPLPNVVQILEGAAPANTGPVLFARPPYQEYQYSGGGIQIMQLALTDHANQPFARLMQHIVLQPLQMAGSSFEPAALDDDRFSYAHNAEGKRMEAPWHIYPEQAAAGLWTVPSDLARFIIEIQRAVRGPSGKVLAQAAAREMVSPVGTGPFSVGLRLINKGEGWYFFHGGSNWGFESRIIGHVRKGYGLVVMTNAQDSGVKLLEEIQARVAAAYQWDYLEQAK